MAKSPNPMHYAKHIKIRVDGKEYPTLEGGTFKKNGKTRETVTGDEVHGYTETAVPASISVQVPANHQTDFEDINDHTNVTIEVEIDTGQIYMMRNAWNTNPVELTGGNFTLEYMAKTAEKIA